MDHPALAPKRRDVVLASAVSKSTAYRRGEQSDYEISRALFKEKFQKDIQSARIEREDNQHNEHVKAQTEGLDVLELALHYGTIELTADVTSNEVPYATPKDEAIHSEVKRVLTELISRAKGKRSNE